MSHRPMSSPTEIEREDVQSFVSALALSGSASCDRQAFQTHPELIARLASSPEPLTFEFEGHLDLLPGALRAELRTFLDAAYPDFEERAESWIGEISFLVRFFAGVANDARPLVRLGPPGGIDIVTPARTPRLSLAAGLGGAGTEQALDAGSTLPGLWGLPETAFVISEVFPARALASRGASAPRLDLVVSSYKGATTPRSAPETADQEPTASDLVLVSMPFADLRHPSIGLSLLKQSLPDVDTSILYFTVPFAQRIGAPIYDWISSGNPAQPCLVGEWLFSSALNGDLGGESDYVDEILRDPAVAAQLPESAIRNLLAIRERVDSFLDDCVDEVLSRRPRIVGFTSVFQQQVASLALAGRLKARDPELTIVFGGANCEGVMGLEMLAEFTFVDAVVSGEGEVAFPRWVDRVLKGRPVDDLQGVYTRQSAPALAAGGAPPSAPRVARMDDLPFADYEDLFRTWEAGDLDEAYSPRLLFETSRGCWWGEKHHCTFCGLNGSSMAFRSKSPERALEELIQLTTTHPGAKVAVVDNIMDMGYLQTLLPTLAERQLGVELFYEMKSNLRKDHLRLMHSAGLTEFQPGIESFSTAILHLMRKGVSGLQNIQLLKWCSEIGIHAYWNVLWGFPREPADEYERMAELVPLLTHLRPPVKAGAFRLDRFSPNFVDADALGLEGIEPFPAYAHLYPQANGSLARLAYYFEYGYQESQDVENYTRPLARRLAEWQDVHAESSLVYLDKGDALFVFDHRPAAIVETATLSGLTRRLFLACDEIRTLEALVREVGDEGTDRVTVDHVEASLKPMIENGWLIREQNNLLALAVNARP